VTETLYFEKDGPMSDLGTANPTHLLHIGSEPYAATADPTEALEIHQAIGIGTVRPLDPLHFVISTETREEMRINAGGILIGGKSATDAEVVAFLKRLAATIVLGRMA